MLEKVKWKEIFLLLLLLIAILLPRVSDLDEFVTADEHLWLTAAGNFYYALGQREFIETYRFEAPAVTMLWAGVAGYVIEVPEFRGWGQGYLAREKLESVFEAHDIAAIDILATARLFVILQLTVVLIAAFYYGRKLFGLLPALVGFLLIALDPFYIALTQLFHMDGLLSAYMLLAVLAYSVYLFHGKKRLDLWITGVAFGLSLLSKSPGIFLLPMLGLMTLIAILQKDKQESLSVKLKFFGLPYLQTILIGAGTFFVLWPAMWVAPIDAINNVFISAFKFAAGGHDTAVFFNGRVFIDKNIGLDLIEFYPITYLWRATPVVLLGIILFIFSVIRKKSIQQENNDQLFLNILGIMAVTFAIFMTLGGKKFARYLIPAYLPLDLLAGVVWVKLLTQWEKSNRFLSAKIIIPALLLIQFLLGAQHAPYYYAYFNPLMGGGTKAQQHLTIGWGEGLDQAANYLADKPNAKNQTVLSWYGMGPFSYFYPGETLSIWIQPNWQRANARSLLTADYIVTYIHQEQREMTDVLLDVLATMQPEHTVSIQKILYVKIYAVKDISDPNMKLLLAPVLNQ
ncbi:MAG: phospholipid carrier-dependent glycosyltransferase [Chloroflexota bacterium]